MSVLGFVKGALDLAVSAGAGVVVGNVIRATTPENIGRFGRILVGFGSFGIGVAVSEIASKAVNNNIDNIVNAFKGEEEEDPLADAVTNINLTITPEQARQLFNIDEADQVNPEEPSDD